MRFSVVIVEHKYAYVEGLACALDAAPREGMKTDDWQQHRAIFKGFPHIQECSLGTRTRRQGLAQRSPAAIARTRWRNDASREGLIAEE